MAQAAVVWKCMDPDEEELQDFIETGRLGEVKDVPLPYNPAIMEAIAKQKWSM